MMTYKFIAIDDENNEYGPARRIEQRSPGNKPGSNCCHALRNGFAALDMFTTDI